MLVLGNKTVSPESVMCIVATLKAFMLFGLDSDLDDLSISLLFTPILQNRSEQNATQHNTSTCPGIRFDIDI